ncbi:lipopolysaccharide biosynthesis protein [Psychrobacter celer]|uniref:lipopolysaccharide biosynthesis protein n=1 Tax=Psychrobacter celer TaxID=306572 RepID=UPI003FCF4A2E
MKKSLFLLLMKIFGAFSTLATGMLISRNFGEEYFAEYSLVVTLIALGVLFSNWGTSNFVVQNFKRDNIDIRLTLLVNIIFAIVFIIIVLFFKNWLGIENFFIAIFSIIFYSLFLTKSAFLIMTGKQIKNSLINDFLKNFLLMISFFICVNIGFNSLNKIYALYYSILILISYFVIKDIYSLGGQKRQDFKVFFVQGFYITVSSIIILLLAQLDRFVINYFLDKNSLARYFLSYTLVSLISLFSQSLIVIYLPKVSEYIGNDNFESLRYINKNYSRIIIVFTLFQTIIYNIILKYIFLLYKIELYLNDYIVLNILMLGVLISNMFGIGMTIAAYSEDKLTLVKIQLIVLLVYLPLVVLTVKYYGIIGAAISFSICQIAVKYLLYLFYRKKRKLNLFFIG